MKFPHPENTGPDGLLAVGGDLNIQSLIEAYSRGIFPWPQEGLPLLWFSPPQRGVLDFNQYSIPKSTAKAIRQKKFEITFNQNFKGVIESCARVKRQHENSTWILPEMIEAYVELYKQDKAISVEAWLEGELVGGLYGVNLQGVFSGESMFFKKSEASKVCLASIVEYLKNKGHHWIDIQMVTPLLEKFGGRYIDRHEYLQRLKKRQLEVKSLSSPSKK